VDEDEAILLRVSRGTLHRSNAVGIQRERALSMALK
jgi:hypothetical protein